MQRARLFVLLAALLLSRPLAAQDIKVQASVNANMIGADELLTYTLEIQGASFADVEVPEPPPTSGLAVLQSTPSTQRNVSFINGQMQQSVGFRWTYRPVREGKAYIRPTAVRVKDKTYRTAEIRVTVVPQAQRPQRAQTPSPFGNRTRSTPDPEVESEGSSISQDDLFIRAEPSTRRAYQNEQITITYRLYFREGIQIRQSRMADSWDAEGFWREDLEVETRPIPETTVHNGLRYRTIVLKRTAVFPTRPGALKVDPLRISTEVYAPRRSRDPFDHLFSLGHSFEAIELTSQPVPIETRPLPDGAPDSFKGAVGTFDLQVNIDEQSVDVGEAVQMQVRIAGEGNLATLEPPLVSPPGTFETYEPEVKTTIDRSSRRIQGTKTFTYVLVPRSNGTFELPPVVFSYFDPHAERYQMLTSEPVTIQVTGSAAAPPAASTTGAGLPVDDIAAPMEQVSNWHRTDRTPLHANPWTYAALFAPWLALLGLLAYRRHTERLANDPALARRRQARPEADRRLAAARQRIDADAHAFYAEVERAVLGFIGDRLNTAPQGLTRPQLDAMLDRAGVPPILRQDLHHLLDRCAQTRFAPLLTDHTAREADLDRARELIIALDRALQAPSTVST